MELKLLKDWAGYKKGETITISDAAVISAGITNGVFVEAKSITEPKPEPFAEPKKKGK